MHGLSTFVHHHGQHPFVPVLCDVLPFQPAHVAQPQTAVAGEKIGIFDNLNPARCRNQFFHFVDGQELPLPFVRLCPFMARQPVHRVEGDDAFADGDIECRYQGALAVEHGLGLERLSACCPVTGFQVLHERQAEVLVHGLELHLTASHVGNDAAKSVYRVKVTYATAFLYLLEPCEPLLQGDVRFRYAVLRFRKPLACGRQFFQFARPLPENRLRFPHGGGILAHGFLVRFRNEVEFQVLVAASAVMVAVQINGPIPVLHRLEPDFYR